MSDFSRAHAFTARWEGGLSDHPQDRGGLTAHGASIEFVKGIACSLDGENFLRTLGVLLPITRQSIRNLTKDQAAAMFRREFWDALRLDRLPWRQAALIYDAAVNMGRIQAVKLSQRGHNRLVTYGERLQEDGLLGPLTLAALGQDTNSLVKAAIQCRREFYRTLARQRPGQAVFLSGWLNRANGLEKFLLGDCA